MKTSLGIGYREVGLLVGMGGNGKTTLLRKLVRATQRAITFDPLGVMYPGIVLESREALEGWLDVCGDNPRFRLVYRPQIDESDYEGMKSESEYLCWVARNIENVSIFFDELDTFARTDDAAPELTALLNFGRKHYVSVFGTVRRPQVKVPRDWVTEATVVYVFQTTDPLDCGCISRKTLIQPEELPRLEQFHYWEWHSGGECQKRILDNPYRRK